MDEAKKALGAVNPEVEVLTIASRLEGEALERQVAASDVVLDCSDNFATRHAVNRACVKHAKPLVAGAAIRFDGQLMVFDLSRGDAPCYACVFPEEGESEELRCAVTGVLAPLTGIIGAMQAMEAIKLVARAGEAPAGLVIFDAKKAEWRSVRVKRDPACRTCAQT